MWEERLEENRPKFKQLSYLDGGIIRRYRTVGTWECTALALTDTAKQFYKVILLFCFYLECWKLQEHIASTLTVRKKIVYKITTFLELTRELRFQGNSVNWITNRNKIIQGEVGHRHCLTDGRGWVEVVTSRKKPTIRNLLKFLMNS